MMFTKEQMIRAWVDGAKNYVSESDWIHLADAEQYVDRIAQRNVDMFGANALRIAPEASATDQSRSGHLPPVGTPEEVLARCLASLMVRCAVMFVDQPGGDCMFSTNWQEAQLEALRTAYPILGALEDAREEVKA